MKRKTWDVFLIKVGEWRLCTVKIIWNNNNIGARLKESKCEIMDKVQYDNNPRIFIRNTTKKNALYIAKLMKEETRGSLCEIREHISSD